MKTLTTISAILGILTLLSILLSHLALTDIYNNTEPDLTLEWNTVRLGYLLTFIFVVIALITIMKKKSNL
jgi:L-asparagine transporter-like permease